MNRRKVCEWLAWNATWIVSLLLIPKTSGIITFVFCGLVVLGFFSALRVGIGLIAGLFNRAPQLSLLRKLMLACLSLILGLVIFEVFLAVRARTHKPGEQTAQQATPPLTMPENWKSREVNIPGAARAVYWHDILHISNSDMMRHLGEFGPKRADTFRVMVVGDSLTYGHGVAAEATYCSVLERELGRRYRIEVLNLGRCGDESEDIARTVKSFLPRLRPDMVIYGVCVNDFLPSGKRQYQNNRAWTIRFPLQQHFIDKTRVGSFVTKKYDELLLVLGVRADFVTDILRDFEGYQQRFARDVKQINNTVTAAGLPPVTTLVLNQCLFDDKIREIMVITERLLAEAGMRVVPSAPYVEKNAGKVLTVSHWEGHPNAECHAIFAAELLPHIERAPGLEKYRRGSEMPPTF